MLTVLACEGHEPGNLHQSWQPKLQGSKCVSASIHHPIHVAWARHKNSMTAASDSRTSGDREKQVSGRECKLQSIVNRDSGEALLTCGRWS